MRNLTGRNLRDVAEAFRSLGGTVEHLRRTGEERYTHPLLERPLKINMRRKDAPRCLTTAVAKIERIRRA